MTQPRAFGAMTGQGYGSFAGKAAFAYGPHPVGVLTQPLAFGAMSGMRYGSFAGKTEETVAPGSDSEWIIRTRRRRR